MAGRNNRYNNMQIDGAVNNDLFGIAASGGRRGQRVTQPISLDAIQEIQLVVSPYDVRQGGFTGGGVNAITKSGSNNVLGTGFYDFRNQRFVGTGIDKRPIATFSDKQFGATIGGPMVRNKAFILGNIEWGRKNTPSGYSVSGASGVSFGRQVEAQRFLDILKSRYGYTPGDLNEFIRGTNNNKMFVRTDFNVGTSQLTVRHNYVDGFSDVGTQTNVTYKFADNFYRFHSKTNSIGGTAQLEFWSGRQRSPDHVSAHQGIPHDCKRVSPDNSAAAGRRPIRGRNGAVFARQRRGRGQRRTDRRLDDGAGLTHDYRRHP